MILRCSCSAPATHQLRIQLVPVVSPAAADPGTQYGYFSARHLPSLAKVRREYGRAGLAVIDYSITELWTAK